jgi:hypothetical protein
MPPGQVHYIDSFSLSFSLSRRIEIFFRDLRAAKGTGSCVEYAQFPDRTTQVHQIGELYQRNPEMRNNRKRVGWDNYNPNNVTGCTDISIVKLHECALKGADLAEARLVEVFGNPVHGNSHIYYYLQQQTERKASLRNQISPDNQHPISFMAPRGIALTPALDRIRGNRRQAELSTDEKSKSVVAAILVRHQSSIR